MKQATKKIVWLVAFLGINTIGLCTEPFAKGPYLGQTPPGPVAQVFAPGLICDTRPGQWEAWPSFSADGNTFCFNRLRYVYVTENTDKGWTTPKRVESIPYHSVTSCLSPDANSIYVRCDLLNKLEQRRTPLRQRKYSFRRCTRTSEGWSLPQEVGPPFSTWRQSGGFSVAADNSIYFWGSKGVEKGQDAYWVAPFDGNAWTQAIKIPLEKGSLNPCHPGVAPDAIFMVFYSIKPGARGGTETDLYLTLRRPDGTWTKLRNMGPKINTGYYEWGARISPDKKYMFFTRSTGWDLRPVSDTGDIYWVELKEYLPEAYR